MNKSECAELRRAFDPKRATAGKITGAYVNSTGEIIAKFGKDLYASPEDEGEKYLSIFRKTLSGRYGKNLNDIALPSFLPESDDRKKALISLVNGDFSVCETIFKEIISSFKSKENYVILLTRSKYDVPTRSKDGEIADSCEVFTFVTCAVCPVKLTKSSLAYDPEKKEFNSGRTDNIISPPDIGFNYPAFDDRRANIHSALFYTKSADEGYPDVTSALFGEKMKMPANEQRSVFNEVLADSLKNECSFDVIKNLRKNVCAIVEEHKASKEREELFLTKNDVRSLLQNSGVKEDKLESFTENFSQSFGANADVIPENVIDTRKIELKTPDVVIKVAPGKEDLVRFRVIDGTKYLVIRASDGVVFNGINVKVSESEK